MIGPVELVEETAPSEAPASEAPKRRVRPVEAISEPKRVRPIALVSEVPTENLRGFLEQPPVVATIGSPVTPTAPQTSTAPTVAPLPTTERETVEAQADTTPDVRIGEAPATLPRFGKEGTLARSFSDVLSGVGEWALNKPEEALATLTPLGPAIAARYAPAMAQQWGENLLAGLKGDKKALNDAIALATVVGLPIGAKRAYDSWRVNGPSRVQPPSPEQAALDATRPPPLLPQTAAELTKPKGEPSALPQRETAPLPLENASRTGAQVGAQVRVETEAPKAQETLSAPLSESEVKPNETQTQKEGQVPVGAPEPASPTQPAAESEVPRAAAPSETAAAGPVEPAPPSLTERGPGLVGMGGATPNEFAPRGGSPIGNKNAIVDAERVKRGLQPLMAPARHTWGAAWDEAMARLDRDPSLPDRLTAELLNKPRPISDTENAVLVHRYNDLRNEYDKAAWNARQAYEDSRVADMDAASARMGEWSERMAQHEQAVNKGGAGTELGRGLAARRMLVNDDFSPASLEMQKRAANDWRPLTREERADLIARASQYEKLNGQLQTKLAAEQAAHAAAEARAALAEAAKAAAKQRGVSDYVLKTAEKWVAQWGKEAAEARKALAGKFLSPSPEDLLNLAKIVRFRIGEVGLDTARITVDLVSEFGEGVRPYIQGAIAKAQELIDAMGAELPAAQRQAAKTRATKADSPEALAREITAKLKAAPAGDVSAATKRLAGMLWEKGAREADAIAEGLAKSLNLSRSEALAKMFGAKRPKRHPKAPDTIRLEYQLNRLQEQFHEEILKDEIAQKTRTERFLRGAMESVNATRVIMTSADLSAVLRQGKLMALAHPIRASRSIMPMLRAFSSKEKAFAVQHEIVERPNYPFYKESGLYLAEHGGRLSQMEEAYMSRWVKKLPLVGASERAYSTFLNKLRADSFDAMAATLVRKGGLTPDAAKVIANYINLSTGRGRIGFNDQAAAGMNTFLFAPRYVASRWQMLLGEPIWHGAISRKVPFQGTGAARRMVALEYAHMLGGAAVVYSLGLAAGAELEIDPRSTDFGKLRFGNTRIDPMSGLIQNTVLLSRLWSGEKKTAKGKIVPIRGKVPYGGATGVDLIARYGRSKLAPLPGATLDLVSGQNFAGFPTDAKQIALNLVTPISIGDIVAAMREQGWPEGAIFGVLSIFGEGVQTYDAARKPEQR